MSPARLTVLSVLTAAGLSVVYLIPPGGKQQPAGVRLALPEYLGRWYGVDQKITDKELTFLANDTEFARKQYTNGTGDTVLASIVLSGQDLDNSIHRPERCLPAQGWTIADSRRVHVRVPTLKGGALPVTRLHDVRQVPTSDGRVVSLYHLNYYWFIGYNHVTASHLERTLLDISDRLIKGYNQRWAFVTVASEITEGRLRFGKSEKETDEMLQQFIATLSPTLQP